MITVAIPPAVEVLAVIGSVYGIIQALKKIPALTEYLTGWVAITINILLTVCGLLLTIPANQLYTVNTAVTLLMTILSSAGIHGTVSSMSPPTVLATLPPSNQVKAVPAVLEPINPAAVVAEKPKE